MERVRRDEVFECQVSGNYSKVFIMTRGNQRDLAREKNLKKQQVHFNFVMCCDVRATCLLVPAYVRFFYSSTVHSDGCLQSRT